MSKRLSVAVLLGLFVLAHPARAWDAFGHEVIARIAWNYLTPQARRAALALLEQAPDDSDLLRLGQLADAPADAGRGLFLLAATWPDVVRDQSRVERFAKYMHGSWHYINYYFRDTGRGPRDLSRPAPDSVNAVVELERESAELGNPAAPAPQRAIALAWVLHLGGDIHQPLHTASRVTSALPGGDAGGNMFRLAYGNLHGYWDSAISRQYPEEKDETPAARVERVAAAIMQGVPPREFAGVLQAGQFAEWAQGSYKLAKAAYRTPEGQEPDREYREAAFVTADRQAALAGYRLALLLNKQLVAPAR